MTHEFANKMTDALCRCRKINWSNGEKKLYSGYMNKWLKYINHYGKEEWSFTYKQKRIYDFDKISEYYKYSLTKREKIKWLLDNEWYYFPVYVYGSAFMSCRIVNHDSYSLLIWSTCDDDSGYDFKFPSTDLNKVKDFIKDNFKSIDFDSRIINLIEINGYKYY